MGEIIRFTVAGSPLAVSRAIEEYAHGEGRVSAIVVPWESDAATLSMAVTAVKSDGWAIEHRGAPERLPTGAEHAVQAGRSAAAGVYSRLAGYEDLNDAERLATDSHISHDRHRVP